MNSITASYLSTIETLSTLAQQAIARDDVKMYRYYQDRITKLTNIFRNQ